ncbi:hypothetical protein M0802_006808 [Mischocyttarus mexicanus]|nr:hypothetical protein M0802_006808 [Mischocyttarus mexicanus]
MNEEAEERKNSTVTHIWKVTSLEHFFNMPEKLISPLFKENYNNMDIEYKIWMQWVEPYLECQKCCNNYAKEIHINTRFIKPLPMDIVIEIEYKFREELVARATVTEELIVNTREHETRTFLFCQYCETELKLKCLFAFNVKLDRFNYRNLSKEEIEPLEWEQNLVNYFRSLYYTRNYSDIIFNVRSRLFSVHCLVLSQYYFFKSLIIKAIDNEHEVIELHDIEPEIFNIMLKYIYTGDEFCVNNHAKELLVPASKFFMADLVESCVTILKLQININNALDIFVIANETEALELITDVKRFIGNNLNEIKQLDSYPDFEANHPNLLVTILNGLLER